jgi:hypothetical protein
MTGLKLLLTITFLGIICQSCGINNYFKAKKLREAIATEDKRTENLIKKWMRKRQNCNPSRTVRSATGNC